MKDLSVAITGASGFVGLNLINRLERIGVSKITLIGRRAIKKYKNINIDFEKDHIPKNILNGIDVVFHLAGVTHDIKNKLKNRTFYKLNVDVTIDLATIALNSNVKKFIFLSSVKAGSTSLEDLHLNKISSPEGVYGKSKRKAESELERLFKDKNMSIVILRPSLIYGRYVKGNLEKLIRFIKKNKLFSFPNTFNKRSMIHVENLIDGILLCCKTKENFKIYNINDNKNYNTHEIISKLSAKLNKEKNRYTIPFSIIKLIAFIGDIFSFMHFTLNSKQLNKLFGNETYSCNDIIQELGYSPKLNFDDAINDMLEN